MTDQQSQPQSHPLEAKPVMTFDAKDIEANKLFACLSYVVLFLLPLFLIPMFVKKDSKFCQEHARQGTVFYLAVLAVAIVGMFVPVIGWVLAPLIGLALFLVAIIAIIKTLMGEFWEIPLIGKYRYQIDLVKFVSKL